MRYLLAFILPPAAVLLSGKPKQLLANIPLTACLWLPGVVHALLVARAAADEERAERLAAAILASERRQVRRRAPVWRRAAAPRA